MNPEASLEQLAWMRRLAHSLVFDQSQVDDVVQETWLSMLEQPQQKLRNPRAWFSTLLKHKAMDVRKAEVRRERREQKAAREEEFTSEENLEELVKLQRKVSDSVLLLDEPYRSTVLQRFFEDLTPGQIAKRQEVPIATVYTRLNRALEQMRSKLDGDYGNRRAWCLALLPLAKVGKVSAAGVAGGSFLATVLGGILVTLKAKLLAIGALIVISAVGFWSFNHSGDKVIDAQNTKEIFSAIPVEVEKTTSIENKPVEANELAARSSASSLVRLHFLGRVLDEGLNPVEGVKITLNEATPTGALLLASCESAKDGGYSMSFTKSESEARKAKIDFAFDEKKYSLFAVILKREAFPEWEHVLIVSSVGRILGTVTDRENQPIQNAKVEYVSTSMGWMMKSMDSLSKMGLDVPSMHFFERHAKATSNFSGYFDLGFLPESQRELRVYKEGYKLDKQVKKPGNEVQLIMEKALEIRGIVVDSKGNPLEDASVSLGWIHSETSTSDSVRAGARSLGNGEFVLVIGEDDYIEKTASLVATKHGYQLTKIENFGAEIYEKGEEEENHKSVMPPVKLVLNSTSLAISGKIFNSDGKPATSFRVSLVDPTFSENMNRSLERESEVNTQAYLADPVRERGLTTQYDLGGVHIDKDGSFRIGGLANRPYRLIVWDVKSLFSVKTESIAAGSSEVEIRIPPYSLRERVSGHVLSRSGIPVSDIEVRPSLLLVEGAKKHQQIWTSSSKAVKTDLQGYFEFTGLADSTLSFSIVDHQKLENDMHVEIAQGANTQDLKFVIPILCRVQLRIAPEETASVFSIRDEKGETLMMKPQIDGQPANMTRWQANELVGSWRGKIAIFEVSEDAKFLAFQNLNGEVIRKVPLQLKPGEITQINF